MATTQINRLGIVEIAKRTNNGDVLTVSEVLSRNDEWLQDAQWVPANQLASHVHTRRLSLPAGTWRKMNTGATIEVSHTKQVVENIGRLESWSQVDEAVVATLLGDQQKFLSGEDAAFIMGLGQELSSTFITGDTTTAPEEFDGLNIRTNATGTYVKGCGGTGSDTTSAYFIQWGEDRVHLIYQPTIGVGTTDSPVKVKDHGLQAVTSAGTTTLYNAYRTQFVMTCGLALHDDRCLCRMANIEDDVSGANLFEPDYAVELLNSMLMRGKGAYLYAHQKVLSQLDVMAMDKVNVMYTINNLWGEPVTYFRGNVPVRQLDAIGITQAAIS
jgi:hypothetical protein